MRDLPSFARTALSFPVLALVLLSIGYAGYQRSFLEGNGGGTFWDVVLGVLFSPQFIGWVALPSWLIYLLVDVKRFARVDVLYRVGSRGALWWASLRRDATAYASGAFAIVLALYLSALGLPLEGAEPAAGVRTALISVGVSIPLVALLCQVGFLFVTFLVVAVLVRSSFSLTSRFVLPVGIAVAIFIWVLLSSSGVIPALALGNAGRFLGAIATLRDPFNGVVVAIVWILVLGATRLLVGEADRRVRGMGIDWSNPWIYLIFVDVLLVGIGTYQLALEGVTLEESIAQIFRGNLGTLSQSLTSVVVYVGFAWAIQLQINRAGTAWRQLELMRLGSLALWFWRVLRRTVIYGLVYLLVLFLVLIVAFMIRGRGDFDVTPQTWFQFGVTGMLELLLYSLISVASSVFFGSRLAGIATLAGLVALSVVPVLTVWYPFGTTSLARVELGWAAVLAAAASTGTALIVVLVGCWIFSRTPQLLKWRLT